MVQWGAGAHAFELWRLGVYVAIPAALTFVVAFDDNNLAKVISTFKYVEFPAQKVTSDTLREKLLDEVKEAKQRGGGAAGKWTPPTTATMTATKKKAWKEKTWKEAIFGQ